MPNNYIKGRGAQKNVANRFFELSHTLDNDFLDYCHKENETPTNNKTQFQEVFPKSIVNKVKSPDVGMTYSLNPYQGCEHGCIYCYARNSHEYWGYSAGLDFEQKILVKKNAAKLLENKINSKSWKATPIVLSGNTDCYQPIEKKLNLTRSCLQVFLNYKHPVAIITKNALITRDLDILKALAKDNLIRVNISVTSLNEETRRLLEPRTASIKLRLKTIKTLTEANIPVNVMMAPIIPGINSHEILPLVKKVSEVGATSVGYTLVRLNGAIADIFSDWIKKTMPNKAEKVLHQIADCHNGNLHNSQYGQRMRGNGVFAKQIADLFKIAQNKYLSNKEIKPLNNSLFEQFKTGQYKLF
ncbi:MAG: PA0069 family radical SAM protein [Mesonia hippocampi]|uniref:PA0069 family radical SAM protein n=1 Tax=Mesonia hippocampi TaxID=1628250 RepID=UPI003F9ABD7B